MFWVRVIRNCWTFLETVYKCVSHVCICSGSQISLWGPLRSHDGRVLKANRNIFFFLVTCKRVLGTYYGYIKKGVYYCYFGSSKVRYMTV